MSRLVQPIPSTGLHGGEGDGYFDRVAKYIPAEIIAAYLTLQGAATAVEAGFWRFLALAIVLVGLLIFTPIYFHRLSRTTGLPWKRQAWVAAVALLIWAYALVSLPSEIGIYNGFAATAVLIAFTLAAGGVKAENPAPAPAPAPPAT